MCVCDETTRYCIIFFIHFQTKTKKKIIKRLFLSSVAMKFHCMSQACQITFRLNFDMKTPSVRLLHNVWNIDRFYLSGVNLLYFPTEYNTKNSFCYFVNGLYFTKKWNIIRLANDVYRWCYLILAFHTLTLDLSQINIRLSSGKFPLQWKHTNQLNNDVYFCVVVFFFSFLALTDTYT